MYDLLKELTMNTSELPVKMTVKMIIDLVERVRYENLLTIRDVAKEIGVSSNVIVSTFKGRTNLSFISIGKYIKFLNKHGYKITLTNDDQSRIVHKNE